MKNSFDKIGINGNKEYLKKETEKRIGKIIEKRALKKDVELTASVKI